MLGEMGEGGREGGWETNWTIVIVAALDEGSEVTAGLDTAVSKVKSIGESSE